MGGVINRILKIISTAIFIVLVLIIIAILGYLIRVKYLASNDRLGEVNMNFYTILTQSMYPTIEAGDVVVTYKDSNNHYNEGDIITFNSEVNAGMTITHRINHVYNVNGIYSYQTKGDNNNAADSEITKGDNVLGKVVVRFPKVGYFQQFVASKFGFLVVILLPALGIVIYDIIKLLENLVRKSRNIIVNDNETIESRMKLKEVIGDESER